MFFALGPPSPNSPPTCLSSPVPYFAQPPTAKHGLFWPQNIFKAKGTKKRGFPKSLGVSSKLTELRHVSLATTQVQMCSPGLLCQDHSQPLPPSSASGAGVE